MNKKPNYLHFGEWPWTKLECTEERHKIEGGFVRRREDAVLPFGKRNPIGILGFVEKKGNPLLAPELELGGAYSMAGLILATVVVYPVGIQTLVRSDLSVWISDSELVGNSGSRRVLC